MKNRIEVLLLPAHTSYLLQPADIEVFEPLAIYYRQEIDRLIQNGVRHISKAE